MRVTINRQSIRSHRDYLDYARQIDSLSGYARNRNVKPSDWQRMYKAVRMLGRAVFTSDSYCESVASRIVASIESGRDVRLIVQ